MDIGEIKILDIQPSQFYLSNDKIVNIMKWFDPLDLSNFEPIPIKLLKNKIVFTDGHTRAFVAYNAGLTKIPLVWDVDELDWETYQLCVSACEKRGVISIADMENRILSSSEYLIKWMGWCEVLHEILELQRL